MIPFTVVAWLVVRWWFPFLYGAEALVLGILVGWLSRPLVFRRTERARKV